MFVVWWDFQFAKVGSTKSQPPKCVCTVSLLAFAMSHPVARPLGPKGLIELFEQHISHNVFPIQHNPSYSFPTTVQAVLLEQAFPKDIITSDDTYSEEDDLDCGSTTSDDEFAQTLSTLYQPPEVYRYSFGVRNEEIQSDGTNVMVVTGDSIQDEFKWRKYGQKQVKGSNFPRNYYKCTVSGCPAKKHTEYLLVEGKNSLKHIYINEHVHPPPNSNRISINNQNTFRQTVLGASKVCIRTCFVTDPNQHKGDLDNSKACTHQQYHIYPQSTKDNKLILETGSSVDQTDDGYQWRKYGQKIVKGTPIPRQYFRCTTTNCFVKKQVEIQGEKAILAYTGTHNHPPPLSGPPNKRVKLEESSEP